MILTWLTPGIPLPAGDAKVKVDHRRQVLPLTDGFSSWPGLRSTSVPKRISACDQTCSYTQQVARNWVAAQCLEDKYNQCQIDFFLVSKSILSCRLTCPLGQPSPLPAWRKEMSSSMRLSPILHAPSSWRREILREASQSNHPDPGG